jgi:rod shape-determining protein MreC
MSVFAISRRRAIAILALTSVLLITLDLRGNPVIDGARGAFGVVFAPFRDSVEVVTRPIENAWKGIRDYDDLAAENERLREEIDRQRGATIAAEASVMEAQELLALNGLPTLAGIDYVTAQVVGVSPSNFSQTVEISQGSDRGIEVGMPVVNGAGLVGKVHKVYPDRAIVMLVTDPEFAIGVKVGVAAEDTTDAEQTTVTAPNGQAPGAGAATTSTSSTSTTSTTVAGPGTTTAATLPRSNPLGPVVTVTTVPSATTTTVADLQNLTLRETGALVGRGPTRPPVVGLVEPNPRFGELAPGAWVVTAGGATSLAPPDIVVGRVSRVVERAGSAGPLLEVRLSADLEDLNFVRVLLYQPATEAPG